MVHDTLQMQGDSVVVTANRSERKLSNITVPVNIINAKQIQQTGALRLTDILKEQPGLTMTSGFGAGVQLQGLNPDYTIILINGEPLVGRTAGVLDLNRIALANIKKIETIQVNSVIPNWLSEICKKKNLNFIHITTDCVFNGSRGHYTEMDSHNCSDVYGMSKSLGEPENATIIRTSIIGHEKNNKLSLFEWVLSNKNKTINGFSNHYWNGVTCLQLSKIIKQVIEEKNFWTGVRHIYSNKVSKYELVSYINDVYKLNIDIRSVDDQKQIDRTLFSIFNVSNFKIPTIQEQIEEMFYFYQQENL
jgi:dTDP-4-dehydrorhamnose reductase